MARPGLGAIVVLFNVLVLAAGLLALELPARCQAAAWPFEQPLYVPEWLSVRDAPLRWRRPSNEGSNSLGLRNRELKVLVFPISDQVNDDYRKLDQAYVLYPQSRIREICDAYAISVLDLTNPIYVHGGTILFRDYLHLNRKGNDIVTDEIEKHLLPDGL